MKISPFLNTNSKNIKFKIAAYTFVLFVGLFIYFFWFNKADPTFLARNHFNDSWSNITTSAEARNTLNFIQLYNDQRYLEAIDQAEKFINMNYDPIEALLVLGLSYINLEEYDIALRYFSKLTNAQNSENNQGLFLQAMTLMMRNQKGDIEEAKFFLNQAIIENAQGTEIAKRWLNKF